MTCFRILLLFCFIGLPLAASATPMEQVVASLRALQIEVPAPAERRIIEQMTPLHDANPALFAEQTARLLDMANLSQTAQRQSARVRLTELHRQMLTRIGPATSIALDIVDKTDRMVLEIAPGIGLTERDLGWSMMLVAMQRTPSAKTPNDINLTASEGDALMTETLAIIKGASPDQQRVLASTDAWAFGALPIWGNFSASELRDVVSVVTNTAPPPAGVVDKVLGVTDRAAWLAGLDIGLTPAERQQYQALDRFLASGAMAGSLAEPLGLATPDPSGGLTALNLLMQRNLGATTAKDGSGARK
ncbi:hypothetical protein [Actibacterium sp. 188UL27-1]|uniref:hypothetical protein n=1 Tax=Actibacterium sp. 188UL27-1 TaxID=2786961 RepID=UPI00195D5E8C|nr:hypothetical protein [Actibacterium sp. 188UL27-1]MBM7070015.1 hypothetical protein [Actibacterium sp. 188UL27-1]